VVPEAGLGMTLAGRVLVRHTACTGYGYAMRRLRNAAATQCGGYAMRRLRNAAATQCGGYARCWLRGAGYEVLAPIAFLAFPIEFSSRVAHLQQVNPAKEKGSFGLKRAAEYFLREIVHPD